MRTLKKRHSWPPLRISRASYFKECVDSDPFAYFISPASDRDVFIKGDLSAGIDPGKRSKSLSPNLCNSRTVLSAVTSPSSSPTAKLKRWIERMELRCFQWSPRASERPMPSPDPPMLPETVVPRSPPARGRRDVRSGSSLRVNQYQRSKPRRPRVWKEPSEGIWSVAEEGEEIGLGILV